MRNRALVSQTLVCAWSVIHYRFILSWASIRTWLTEQRNDKLKTKDSKNKVCKHHSDRCFRLLWSFRRLVKIRIVFVMLLVCLLTIVFSRVLPVPCVLLIPRWLLPWPWPLIFVKIMKCLFSLPLLVTFLSIRVFKGVIEWFLTWFSELTTFTVVFVTCFLGIKFF